MEGEARCKICGRPLKNPESIARGIGPKCAQKEGLTGKGGKVKKLGQQGESSVVCLHCGEPLRFDPEKGWVHQDGKLYKTKIVDGEEVDDHCAHPVHRQRR